PPVSPTISASAAIPTTANQDIYWSSSQLGTDVQNFVLGTSGYTNGWRIRDSVEDSATDRLGRFDSTENDAKNCPPTGPFDKTVWPVLLVYYTPCTPPTITSQPTNQTVCTGSTATFSVTATGTGLTYQWRKNGTNLVNGATGNGSTYSGVTTATLTISNTQPGDAATAANGYDVVITATGGCSTTSSRVSLTVNPSPTCSITGPDPVCAGTTNSYSGPGSMTSYNWSVSGNGTINGSTNSQSVSVVAGSSGSFTLTLT